MFQSKKEQPIHILELFSYFRSPRSIDITVSRSMTLPRDDREIPGSCDNLYLLISRFSRKDVILSAICFSICKYLGSIREKI